MNDVVLVLTGPYKESRLFYLHQPISVVAVKLCFKHYFQDISALYKIKLFFCLNLYILCDILARYVY